MASESDKVAAEAAGREKTRTIQSHGARIESSGKIGGEIAVGKDAPFLASRLAVWEEFRAEAETNAAGECPL
jgi:hypothetical protein